MQNKHELLKPGRIKKSSVILKAGGVLLLLSAVLLSSCGLPTYAYLYPPEAYTTRNDPDNQENDIIFWNAYNNNSSIFSGYEIYYKIYDPLNASASDTSYLTDISAIEASTTTYTTVLENKGFSRLFVSDTPDINTYTHNEIRPTFHIDADLLEEEFRIRLKFLQEQSSGTSFLAETFNTTLTFTATPYIYRHVTNSSTTSTLNKSFDLSDFDINDNDMPSSVDYNSYLQSVSDGDYYLYITFYILSYGRDIDDITKSVYSEPLYLGTLKFDCDLTNE